MKDEAEIDLMDEKAAKEYADLNAYFVVHPFEFEYVDADEPIAFVR